MKPIFCFIIGAKHRLEKATVYSRRDAHDQRNLFILVAKWKGHSGGYSVPVESINEGAGYVKRDT